MKTYDVRTPSGHEAEVYLHRDGSFRFTRSDHPVYVNDCSDFGIDRLPGWDLRAQTRAVNAYISGVMSTYTERQRSLSDEDRAERAFERRAAFGPGVEVVDVISGERFLT